MNYKKIAEFVLDRIGGESNILSVTHCATRLRFRLRDEKQVNEKELNESDDVIQAFSKSGQYQVIIGTEVPKVYNELINISNLEGSKEESSEKEKGNLVARFFNTISSIFTPLLPALAGAGILRGILLLIEQLGWIDNKSGTYVILSAASMSVFYFLPILLAFTSAQRFKVNPYIAAVIGASLIHPELINLLGDSGNGTVTSFIGIPIILMNYSSTVIPAILAIWVYSYLEKFLEKYIWKSVQIIFVPLISLVIIVPVTVGLFGPFGVYVGEGIANLINWLSESNGWITGLIVGGIWNVFVVFGLQWAVNPIMISNISALGFDKVVPLTGAANFGIAGAAFAVLLKSKNKKMKSFSLSALLSIFFAGITEPAIYGVGMKLKRPFIGGIIGGAVGGAYIGGMGVKSYAFVFGGLTTLPAFVGSTFVHYIIGLVICFVVGAIATYILGFKEQGLDTTKTQNISNDKSESINKTVSVHSPVVGEIKELKDIKDGVFSDGLLGEGIAVIPENGEIYAPADGQLTTLFPTKHAYGLTLENGAEILAHIGINTVELDGKYFETFVEQGQKVKQGQLLAKFDVEQIGKDYDISTPLLLTNKDNYKLELNINDNKVVTTNDILYKVSKL
ncbi:MULTISPECIES: beta-glucoside-specific PTS transporter subunit IIABC [Staphylococcus]|uniref:beta-glucoside-specific PTS transporter subunit IIABC n=1 Tax=Staphylococcus TaxID=1279 RepID=UPI000E68D0A1|nr:MULTISPECIES: beta-glucoside-specific PTS transporter subunit IIABC [Staphylococcus]MDW8552854.1 beta-glucoside-specific PTS transporter subunit IIABC [Staphylococcus nepalensis]RIO41501.1 PTS beta-glucoside transporter subunit EIIBCA [Staphylococcus nepalensis]WQL20281.1 beta-glucoside-specific PTS transporter subunit IIABC [Staphylococcus nepalensis]